MLDPFPASLPDSTDIHQSLARHSDLYFAGSSGAEARTPLQSMTSVMMLQSREDPGFHFSMQSPSSFPRHQDQKLWAAAAPGQKDVLALSGHL